ncbi:site-specific DNA-methyltransferase [Mammaliicoccus sciuri]|uniref:site-specific DNA-methyltransferase n=1 Tax=Mammaliicoccus sciuri TaxID=1296 RepID=UPI000878A571|nr:site-specific DNA-methyltransferase [Mammaliicoccus sciuri]MEB6122664.1 site-specific DNA-methyltransferase [Mammaliicoccus sciuri]MEB6312892.1 site-specific DNA-methyltransferase [Mammaliicoccus sciuri]OFV60537.1 DNA methylase [Mammaliicoccus sciuri]WQJ49767.1 DNA methyltransferase [Mammaliicoccus sciuri]
MLYQNRKYNNENDKNEFEQKLNDNFPEFFNEDRTFDLNKFINELNSSNFEELSMGYSLNFIGKNYAKKIATEKPNSVIVPNIEYNSNNNSENLFYTGDNLEVLKHLQDSYSNSIDLIYIDPPYNTGSDGFIYSDTFKYSDEKLQEMFGLSEDDLKKLKNIEGRSTHSSWLTFMYPRLVLAKKLLSENGTILVSIDDNEQANLRLLMNDIFGEGQVDQLIWNKESEGKSGTLKQVSRFRNVHEYVLIGYKNKDKTEFNKINEAYIGRENELHTANLAVNAEKENKNHKNYFTITNPSGIEFTKQWKWDKEKIEELISQDLIYWGSDGQKQPRLIIPMDDRRKIYLQSILNYGGTTTGRKNFEEVMEQGIFSFPKPVDLIEKLIIATTNENSIILDFFAGSGTTAEAIQKINKEHKSNRRFIMVQIDEETYSVDNDGMKKPRKGSEEAFKNGYLYIDQIARKRIERSYKKYNGQNGAAFRHFYVTTPPNVLLEEIDDIENISTNLFDDMISKFSGSSLGLNTKANGYETILATWMMKDGYKFDVYRKELHLNNYKLNFINNNKIYMINEGWSSQGTKELINLIGNNKLRVQTIVIYPYSFGFEEIRELEIALNQLDHKVNLIKRY